MKKSIVSSVIALGVMAGSAAHAAPVDVTFTGGVTAKTCDISVDSPNAMGNNIELGVVGKGVTGPAVSFALKAANAAGGDCANLTAQDTAQVRWFSPKMDALGLGMTSGEANDSRVLLTAVNTKSANPVSINNSNDTAEFEANKVVNDGLKFEAKLQGGQTPGRFQSVAKVDILYK
ncbi:fimbrial protein [Yersinia kristensenii]|uniref:fimbrial protein n=1 Tax=Yersinia kristensenii TaxID=28152 RepID=UPI001C60CDC5|nr:fimbrial protein [Yersinia kristensenii]MBW5812815.1 fimbrial protein [Yersinia kristensenii]MBW5830116.1 fimbrial protein [Yersinia kristensenii]